MIEPLVTVYIANYNYAAYIGEAIKSVLNQTYGSIEIIVIDDGSTDGSRAIIEDYCTREKIQPIFQENKGLTKTNNVALTMAKGDYIVRLDADDRLQPTAIQSLIAGFTSDKVAMVFGNWNVVDEKGNFLYTYKRHDFQKDVTLMDSPAHGACTMFRTDYLRSIGGYDEELRCQDGYELWFRVIDKFEVKSLDQVVFDYRRHGNNLTDNEGRILSTRAKILRKVARIKSEKLERVFAFIPVRGSQLDSRSMPFQKIGDSYIIDIVLNEIISTNIFEKIVVSTPDKRLINYIEKKYLNSISIHCRSISSAKINTSLDQTLIDYLTCEGRVLQSMRYGVLIGIDRPFNKGYLIESALDIARIFNVHNVIGVRPTRETFFRHTGSSLSGINFSRDSLRLERDELYQMVRGFNVFRTQNLLETNSIWGSVIGHVVFDQKSAFTVDSNLDVLLAEKLHSLSVVV